MAQRKYITRLTPIITEKQITQFFKETNHVNIDLQETILNYTVRKDYGGCVNTRVKDRLVININALKHYSGNEDNFIKMLCSVISHENLHKVIELTDGFNTSQAFDRIVNKMLKGYGVTTIDLIIRPPGEGYETRS